MNDKILTQSPTLTKPRMHRLPEGECKTCDETRGEMMTPPHFASERCESGKRSHCSCDICF